MSTTERAVIFIDGNNFYHGMKSIQLPTAELDYEKFSQKLVMGRKWVETRYYIGQVQQVTFPSSVKLHFGVESKYPYSNWQLFPQCIKCIPFTGEAHGGQGVSRHLEGSVC